MIPYFELTTVYLGPIPIQVWGFFVSLGLLSGVWWSSRRAAVQGLDRRHIWNMAFGVFVSAFVLARLFHVFGYFASAYLAAPLEIFKVWHGGFSATGGILGGLAYFFYYARSSGLSFWPYLDVLSQGFPLGYAIGRIGCFLIHDHPGTLSSFVLAVKYPDGARHDLGLDLSLSAGVMFVVVLILNRWFPEKLPNGRAGFYSGLVFIWYGLTRFFLDFLRAFDLPNSDVRYWGLTVAQYFGIILVISGICIFSQKILWRKKPV